MPNPYYVKPATPDMTPLSMGLGSLVKQTMDKRREQQAQQEVSDALATNDPHQIADAAIKHPELSQAASAAFGFTNDATKKAATQAYRQAISDPANAAEYIQKGITDVQKFGGNPVMMQNDLKELQNNPEGALNNIKMGYASIDPNGWKSITTGTAGLGTLSPELEKAVKSGLVDATKINKGNKQMWEQLAKGGDLSVSKNVPSQALIDSINNGEIDPKFVNSRTIPFYNSIAEQKVNATQAHATAQGKTQAVVDLSKYAANTASALGALDKNFPLLIQSAGKVARFKNAIIDGIEVKAKAKYSNDPNVIQYINSLNTSRAEYARLLSKGGTVQLQDKIDAKEAIPPGKSAEAYQALYQRLKQEGQNILDVNNKAISDIHFGKPGGTTIGSPETGDNSVTVGGQTFNRPANFTDQQWAAYKQSIGAQ